MIKRIHGILLLLFLVNSVALAQGDSIPNYSARQSGLYRQGYQIRDSAFLAKRQAYRDSIKAIGDSLTMIWIKAPEAGRPNKFVDSLISLYKVENLDFAAWEKKFKKKVIRFEEGQIRPKGESWVIGVIILLVLFFAVIKYFFSKELDSIVHSFYSNQVLGQISKEDNLFSSWPFIFLYVLFGLIIGMYLYLSSKYLQLTYTVNGFELFLVFSLVVIGLFTVKILLLRILGFLFDIKRLVKEYVSILYLSYFNAAIIFLPLIIAFSLTPGRYAEFYSYAGLLMLVLIFAVQFLRAGNNILSNYKFPKVYLIIYLCALEFCPLIILFKALRF